MNNTFFTGNDVGNITFTSRLRTFIQDNHFGYYIDIFIPEYKVTTLMVYGISAKYFNEGVDSGFVLRCSIRSNSNILLNGRKLQALSPELSNQSRVVPSNTKIKVLELYPYTESTKRNSDAQCSIIRASFQTEAQKLPKGF